MSSGLCHGVTEEEMNMNLHCSMIQPRLNPDETEVMVVSRPRDLEGIGTLIIDEVQLPLVTHVCRLGLFLDLQVAAGARSTFHRLHLLPFLSDSDLATIIRAFVASRLDSCSALCAGLPWTTDGPEAAVGAERGGGSPGARDSSMTSLHWVPAAFPGQLQVLVLTDMV